MARAKGAGTNPYSTSAANFAAVAGKDVREDLSEVGARGRAQGLNARSIADIVLSRSAHGNSFTQIGSRALVNLSPGSVKQQTVKDGAINDLIDKYMKTCVPFAESFKAESGPPHIFSLAATAYKHMLGNNDNQMILLVGENATGKTESHRLLAHFFSKVGGIVLPETKVHEAVKRFRYVLTALVCARVGNNPQASFSLGYTEYQFDIRGGLCGFQHILYFFQRERVVGNQLNGQNYLIFYLLASQLTPEERIELKIPDVKGFRYLRPGLEDNEFRNSGRGAGKAGFSGEINLRTLKKYLKSLIGQRAQEQLWRVLAGILHIGNIDFEESDSAGNDPCAIKNESALDQAAAMLDIAPLELTSVLVNKTRLIGRDASCIILDKRGCEKQRDSLAHSLYYVVLWWIIERINSRFYKLQEGDDDSYTVISVLEAPGFATNRDTEHNLDLNYLIINYINERLHYFVTESLYELPNKVFECENMAQAFKETKTADLADAQASGGAGGALITNRHTVNMFVDPKIGIFGAIEAGSAQNASDSSISEEIYSCMRKNEVKWTGKTTSDDDGGRVKFRNKYTFKVNHFFGEVAYSTKNYSHLNIDSVQRDFVSLFHGERDHKRLNPTGKFLSNVFSKFVDTGDISKHFAKDATPHVRGLMRAPSIKSKRGKDASRGKKIDRFDPKLSKSITSTITFQTRKLLSELLETARESQTWVLYHLKHPFSRKHAIEAEDSVVPYPEPDVNMNVISDPSVIDYLSSQIEMYNIDRLVRNPAIVYTNALPHAEFLERYAKYLPSSVTSSPMYTRDFLGAKKYAREICGYFANAAPNGPAGIDVAKTRIFLSSEVWWPLESSVILNPSYMDTDQVLDGAGKKSKDINVFSPNVNNDYMTESLSNYLSQTSIGNDRETAAFINASENDIFNDNQSTDNAATINHQDSFSEVEDVRDESQSETASVRMFARDFGKQDDGKKPDINALPSHIFEPPEKKKRKPFCHRRVIWVCVVYMFTFLIPSPLLSLICRMKTKERRMAWREKVTLFILIILLNVVSLFFVVGLNILLCPAENALSPGQISERTKLNSRDVVYMYGRYFYVRDVFDMNVHRQENIGVRYWKSSVLGRDVSTMFDREAIDKWDSYCSFERPKRGFGFAAETYRQIPDMWYPHNPDLWFSLSKRLQTGIVVWDAESIKQAYKDERRLITFYNSVYDVSGFYTLRSDDDGIFFEPFDFGVRLVSIFNDFTNETELGRDASKSIDRLKKDYPEAWSEALRCMNNLFRVGFVDHRMDIRCRAYSITLLVFTVIISALIVVKFLAAVYTGGGYNPEPAQRFVICQIPCYTEAEPIILRTIESITHLDYDDKYRLLFIVCDGMVVGSGNDIPTPRIVLNILGVSPDEDPEPLIFKSAGEGILQLNMAKVYSGVYDSKGRECPFIVVVKTGTPEERFRPGNRGKRDSQLVLMQFLSKLHASEPLNPLELRLCYIMKNLIGVDPRFYEFLMMVDSDTQVAPKSLNYMISSIINDEKVVGVCGETNISNERASLVSMVQVYEYFLSHKMAKGFESLFGSVTCLPGCFCVYRIYNPLSGKVYIASEKIVRLYSKSNLNTLHSRNLLELGEDRYLTTITMKTFPNMKTIFIPHAKASTIVPTEWSILFSQRRRWINSTVHNLFELLLLEQTCGSCLFSLRTVVLIDLIGTFIQPAMIGYVAYLVYINVTVKESKIPLVLIVAVSLIYAVQIILFLIQKEWQYIGWLIIYTLATLLFNTLMPLYSFWKFDDLSWGDTRRTIDSKLKGTLMKSKGREKVFDESMIPLAYYDDYEADIMEQQNQAARIPQDRNMSEYEMAQYGDVDSHISHVPSASDNVYSNAVFPGGVPPAGVSDIGSVYEAPQYWGQQGAPSINYDLQYHPDERQMLSHTTMYEGRLPSAFLDSPKPLPSDDLILAQIKKILETADLLRVTKKSLRTELELHFGVDLSTKKNWINRCIDSILRGDI